MNYELAKQLKDAGFPYKEGRKLTFRINVQETPYDYCDVPSLSELIEACGTAFNDLAYSSGHFSYRAPATLRWEARAYKGGGLEKEIGSTPEEAVARLWLILKAKRSK